MPPVLMSVANPAGWKLEDLLAVLQVEIRAKSRRIENDASPTSERVWSNNQRIIDLLLQAAEIQRDTLAALDKVGPDQGPLGTPRIGKGGGS